MVSDLLRTVFLSLLFTSLNPFVNFPYQRIADFVLFLYKALCDFPCCATPGIFHRLQTLKKKKKIFGNFPPSPWKASWMCFGRLIWFGKEGKVKAEIIWVMQGAGMKLFHSKAQTHLEHGFISVRPDFSREFPFGLSLHPSVSAGLRGSSEVTTVRKHKVGRDTIGSTPAELLVCITSTLRWAGRGRRSRVSGANAFMLLIQLLVGVIRACQFVWAADLHNEFILASILHTHSPLAPSPPLPLFLSFFTHPLPPLPDQSV